MMESNLCYPPVKNLKIDKVLFVFGNKRSWLYLYHTMFASFNDGQQKSRWVMYRFCHSWKMRHLYGNNKKNHIDLPKQNLCLRDKMLNNPPIIFRIKVRNFWYKMKTSKMSSLRKDHFYLENEWLLFVKASDD